MSAMTTAAQALKVELRPIEVSVPGDLEGALSVVGSTSMDGLVITEVNAVCHQLFLGRRDCRQVPRAIDCRTILASRGAALVGYGVDFTAMFRRSAVFVDKILKGANPADIPIEQPTKLKTVVNLKTAKALGVELPLALLARADEVIE